MILARLKGGLGNQMFEYAAARALALRHGAELKLDLEYLQDRTPRPKPFRITFRSYGLDAFNIASTIATRAETPLGFLGKAGMLIDFCYRRLLKPVGTERHFHFDPAFLSFPDGTYLDGLWQSPKYFAGYEDAIRDDFRLKGELPEATRSLGAEMAACRSVCVHVRRADFIGSKHETCDKDYYDRGIAEIGKQGGIDRIYVFSDDAAWCRENLSLGFPTTFVGDEHSGPKGTGHLYLMGKCRSFVIANSSFSWWAAWLAESPGKIVVAPRRWFSDESVDSGDVTPSEWIRI